MQRKPIRYLTLVYVIFSKPFWLDHPTEVGKTFSVNNSQRFLERFHARTVFQKQLKVETDMKVNLIELMANEPSHFTSKELILQGQSHVTHQRITLMHFEKMSMYIR